MSFERFIVGDSIPLEAAADYFVKLKYGSANIPAPSEEEVLSDFKKLSFEEREEILKEAGDVINVDPERWQQGRSMVNRITRDGTGVPTAKKIKDVFKKIKPSHGTKALAVIAGMGATYGLGALAGHQYRKQQEIDETVAKIRGKKKQAEEVSDMPQYLVAEQEGLAAEQQGEAEFLRQKLQQAQQELQMHQETSQNAAQQMQQMQQQIASSNEQIQMAQQGAMQAQDAATQAAQQQLQATDEALQTRQMAAQMRMSYQQLRSQMMDLASQDPAQQIGDQLKGQMPGVQGLGPEAVSMGGGAPPGAPGGMPGAGAPPGAQMPPGAAPMDPAAAGVPAQEQAPLAQPKPPAEKKAPESKPEPKKEANAKVIGAGVGAALGGLGTAIESQMGQSKGLKEKIQKMESAPGGFGKALNIAQAKARLSLAELTEKHPVGASIVGGLRGAAIGAATGPAVQSLFGGGNA